MYKPNYKKNNIVNVVSSISKMLGNSTGYDEYDIELEQYRKVVLIVVDGLGYNYLHNKESFLKSNLVGKLEGAFPLTTAASNTVFSFGVPPQQHGLTGWFVFLKEISTITTVLPFTERYYGTDLSLKGFSIDNIIGVDPITRNAKRNCYKILDSSYSHSPFSLAASKDSEIFGTKPLKGTFNKLEELLSRDETSYTHVYIGEFDSSAHEYGINSTNTREVFDEIDGFIENVSVKAKDAIILVTADHGLLDTEVDKAICLNDYPDIYDCLSIPLPGDSRIAYCYLKSGTEMTFLSLVNKHLGDYVHIFKSDSMIDNNWFGLNKPHPMLKHRVGDYTLIAKDEYIIYDTLANEKRNLVIGHHSGISDDEVFVPLICIKR